MKVHKILTTFWILVVCMMVGGCSGDTSSTSSKSKTTSKLEVPEIAISTAIDDQQNPQVIYLADKRVYFATWEDYRDRNQSGSNVYGKFIKPDGTDCSAAFPITTAAGNQTVPQVAYRQDLINSANKLLITWQDTRGLSDKKVAVATGDGVTNSFSFTLPTDMLVKNNVKIISDYQELHDDGNGNLAGNGAGTVNYNTGVVTFAFTNVPALGANIIAVGNYGFVYFTSIATTNIPDTTVADTAANSCANFVIPPTSFGTPINFNLPHEYNRLPVYSGVDNTAVLDVGNGLLNNFTGTLVAPVLSKNDPLVSQTLTVTVGNVTLTDNGSNKLTGAGGNGTINYTTGALDVTLDVAPASGVKIKAAYSYKKTDVTVYTRLNSSDALVSRSMPKIIYDPGGDRFWIAYVESRKRLNLLDEWFFPGIGNANAIVGWNFGDNSFPGYTILRASDLAFETSKTGVTGADIVRNKLTNLNRRVARADASLTATAEYEFFTNVANVALAVDSTSPAVLMVWDGVRNKGLLNVTCADVNTNLNCDAGEAVTSTFAPSFYENGKTHIYGLFDKEINQGVIFSKYLDTGNNSTTDPYQSQKPAVAFDPISKRFLTVWEDFRDGKTNKIYGQLLTSGGGLYNTNYFIGFQDLTTPGTLDPIVAAANQTMPAVAYDSVLQSFFVAWQDGRNGKVSKENMDIYAQYINGEGTLSGANYAIATNIANQLAPSITYNSYLNQFLAIWKDSRNSNVVPPTTASDIYGQRFSLGQPQLTLLKPDNTSLTPTLLDFGSTPVSTTAYKSFKVRNTGNTALNITSVTLSGSTDFTVTPTTSSLLPSGAEQTFTVSYTPVNGSSSATIQIQSDATNVTVSLNGLGITPQLTVSSNTLAFTNTDVGSNQTGHFTLTNSGTIDVQLNSVSGLSGTGTGIPVFSAANTPALTFPQTLTAGTSLEFYVLFTPPQYGDFAGTVAITTNYASTNQSIALTGKGLQPLLETSATSLDFTNTKVGSFTPKSFTIKNVGNKTMTLNSLAISGSGSTVFTVTSPTITSGSPLLFEPNADVTVTVQFLPTTASAAAGTLTINSDGGTKTVELKGQGTAGVLTVTPAQLDFGTTAVDKTAQKTITLKNSGTAPLMINAITVPTNSAYNVSPSVTAPIQLIENSSLILTVTFKSSAAGYSPASFVIQTDASNGNQNINLQAATSSLAIKTDTLPSATIGTAYSQSLEVSPNGGVAPYTWSMVTPDGGALPTGLTLKPNTGIISGTPTEPGYFVFIAQVRDANGLTATQTLSINTVGGNAVPTNLAFSDASGNSLTNSVYSFGNVLKGTSVTKQFKLVNNGTTAIKLNGVSIVKTGTTTAQPSFTTNLPTTTTTVAAHDSLSFSVSFLPQGTAVYLTDLIITDTDNVQYKQSFTGSGSAMSVKVDTTYQTKASVRSYAPVTATQLPTATKPQGYTISSAVDFVVDGITPGATIPVTIQFSSIPTGARFYKINGNVWTEFTPTVTGNSITYSVTDSQAAGDAASTMDSDPTPGVIHDPVVVGTIGGTTPAGDTTPAPAPASSGGGGGGGCFIATAAYGSYLDPHVIVLRHFRDDVLLQSELGTAFVKFYYKHSPPIADFIAEHDTLRMVMRLALTPLIFAVKYSAIFAVILFAGIASLLRRWSASKKLRQAVQGA